MKQQSSFITIAFALALACFLAMTLAGCGANFFSAKTTATYEITADGKKISYESNKEQQGLDLDLQEKDGKIQSVKIHVDKATTQEQVIAASLALQLKMTELLQTLLPLVEKAALAGGS